MKNSKIEVLSPFWIVCGPWISTQAFSVSFTFSAIRHDLQPKHEPFFSVGVLLLLIFVENQIKWNDVIQNWGLEVFSKLKQSILKDSTSSSVPYSYTKLSALLSSVSPCRSLENDEICRMLCERDIVSRPEEYFVRRHQWCFNVISSSWSPNSCCVTSYGDWFA